MNYLLVRHKVDDFPSWKEIFDSHAAAQREAGLRVEKILRNTDNPSEVVLLFSAVSLQKAREFVSQPEAPEAKQQSGVIDEPDIYFLTDGA